MTLHLLPLQLLHRQRLHLHHALLLLQHRLLLLQVLSLPVGREALRLLAVDLHRNVLQVVRLRHLRRAERSRARVHHLLHVVRRQRRCEALQLRIRQQRQRCVRILVLVRLEDVDLLQQRLLPLLLRLLLALHLLRHEGQCPPKPDSGSP